MPEPIRDSELHFQKRNFEFFNVKLHLFLVSNFIFSNRELEFSVSNYSEAQFEFFFLISNFIFFSAVLHFPNRELNFKCRSSNHEAQFEFLMSKFDFRRSISGIAPRCRSWKFDFRGRNTLSIVEL